MFSWVNSNIVVVGLENVGMFVTCLPVWWDVGSLLKLSFSICGAGGVVLYPCGVLVANFGVSLFVFS